MSERARWAWAVGGAVAAATMAAYLVHDPDVPWHVATGRWMFEHHAVPSADPFSFTHHGVPWQNHSPAPQAILALAEHVLGWGGVGALGVLAVFALVLVSIRSATRDAAVDPAMCAVLAGLAVASDVSGLAPRPRLFAYLLLALGIVIVRSLASHPDRRRGFALVAIHAAWLFTHATHPALVALMAAALIYYVARRDRPRARALLIPTALVVLVLALFGRDALDIASEHQTDAWASTWISEWRETSLAELAAISEGWAMLAILGLAVAGAVSRTVALWPERADRPEVPFEACATLILVVIALAGSGRVLPLVLLGALPLWLPFAAHLPSRLVARIPTAGRTVLASLAVVALIAWHGGGRPTFRPGLGLDDRRFPVAAVDRLEESGARRVYNAYNFGGYLACRGIPVFVDGRALTVYPTEFLQRFTRAYTRHDDFDALAAEHHVDAVLLPIDSELAAPLVRYLDGHPGWRRDHTDRVAVLFLRTHTQSNPIARR